MTSSRHLLLRFAAFLVAVPLCLWVGCSRKDTTEIITGISTQIQVPKDLKSVRVNVINAKGTPVHCKTYPVDNGTVRLPTTLGLLPGGDNRSLVTVTVIGLEKSSDEILAHGVWGDDCYTGSVTDGVGRVLRRARTSYLPGRSLYLPMPLRYPCLGVDCPDPNTTCIAGTCAPMEVKPESLVDYNDSLVYGSGTGCFNATDCFGGQYSKVVVPVAVVDAAKCLYRAQFDVSGITVTGVNVRAIFASANGFGKEILDRDETEGFTIPDEKKPFEFQLAPGLCRATVPPPAGTTSTAQIVGLEASPASIACPVKMPFTAICTEDVTKIQAGDQADDPKAPKVCTQLATLTPTQSALYVLMDRSADMKYFFGEKGLKQVIELSLADPVFQRTQVAFHYLPGNEVDCNDSSNSFATFSDGANGMGFKPAAEAQPLIAGFIGDDTRPLPTNDALKLDAALAESGAYAALGALETTSTSSSFNRKALMILGNSRFAVSCHANLSSTKPTTLGGLAKLGFDKKIDTYVVLLGVPQLLPDQTVTSSPPDGNTYSAANDIATQGGTTLFAAYANAKAGADAFNTIVTDLGSCLYDSPSGYKTVLAGKLDAVRISYFNMFATRDGLPRPTRVDIPYSTDCQNKDSKASGWNLEGSRVRICGQACTDLRASLKANAGFAALNGTKAPDVPLRMSYTCPSK